MIRQLLANSTVRQQQAVLPSFDDAYPAFAKKEGFTPAHEELADGTKAYWIGNTDAEKVILWFHGGGFNIPPEEGHFIFWKELSDISGGKVALLMLSYTLAPHEVYPFQLRQAVELVRYVFTELKRRPQDITFAGDSAGGNMALGVISHILHPHPKIPPLDLGGEKLGAAILLCPWCSFRTDWPSVSYNAHSDFISAPAGNMWSSSFLGGQKSDAYAEPLTAEPQWWEGLDGIVEEVMVLAGGGEVILDSVKELAKELEAVHPKVTTVIAEGEWHDRPIVAALGLGGGQNDAIKSFIKSRL